jgi:hypothetical protein
MRFYDNTKLSCHRDCPRRYYFRHYAHLRAEGTSDALAFGLAWHGAMDVVWDLITKGVDDDHEVVRNAFRNGFSPTWKEQGMIPLSEWTDDDSYTHNPRTPFTAIGMLEAYVPMRRRTILKDFPLLAIERPFVIPLDPSDPELWYCGRLDKTSQNDAGIFILDHKTTTAYKKDGYFRSTFVDSFSPNSQMEGYAFAGNVIYQQDFKGIYIDAALVHKTVHEGFHLLPVLRAEESMDQWLWEARHEVERIEDYGANLTEDGVLRSFPRNTQNCFSFGKPCPYLDLCKAWDNPHRSILEQGTPLGYTVDEWSPFDVNHLEEIGMEK